VATITIHDTRSTPSGLLILFVSCGEWWVIAVPCVFDFSSPFPFLPKDGDASINMELVPTFLRVDVCT